MSTMNSMLAAGAVLFALATVGAAQVQSLSRLSCPGSNGSPEERMQHEKILENAILADFAYLGPGEATLNLQEECPNGVSSPDEDRTAILIHRIPDSIIDEANEVYGGEREGDYIICPSIGTRDERVAAAYEFAEVNGRLSLLIRTAIKYAAADLDTEELAVLRLKNADGDEVLGVRGTEFWRPDQWNGSVSGLIGTSCPFDISVEIAKSFFNLETLKSVYEEIGLGSVNVGRFGAVGHSLGGAVVQHVTVSEGFRDALTILERDISQSSLIRDEFDFRAYSYNSLGVREEKVPKRPIDDLTSVRVAGEVLEQIEADLEGEYARRQIGQIYRYSTDSISRIEPEGIEFHRMKAAKRAICQCLDGTSNTFEAEFQN